MPGNDNVTPQCSKRRLDFPEPPAARRVVRAGNTRSNLGTTIDDPSRQRLFPGSGRRVDATLEAGNIGGRAPSPVGFHLLDPN